MLVLRRNLVDSTLALSQARDTVEILKTSAAVQDITVETTHNPIDAAQGLQDETQERSLIRPETQTDNEIRTGPKESENEQSMSDDEVMYKRNTSMLYCFTDCCNLFNRIKNSPTKKFSMNYRCK
jgi:hypothetical protein